MPVQPASLAPGAFHVEDAATPPTILAARSRALFAMLAPLPPWMLLARPAALLEIELPAAAVIVLVADCPKLPMNPASAFESPTNHTNLAQDASASLSFEAANARAQ